MHVLGKNLRALRGLRYPETQTHMKSFLGMCGAYRRFVADFDKIAKPLTALTSTKLPKIWMTLSSSPVPQRNTYNTLMTC